MFKILPKVLLPLISLSFFIWVIFNIDYPSSLTSASIFQLLYFFIPLFLTVTFSLYLFSNALLASASVGLGIILPLILKALDILNWVSGAITIGAVFLLVSYFKKSKPKNLTSRSNIPKLTSLRRKR